MAGWEQLGYRPFFKWGLEWEELLDTLKGFQLPPEYIAGATPSTARYTSVLQPLVSRQEEPDT